MTLDDAALIGVHRVRQRHWPATDYLAIDIWIHDDGYPHCAPWGTLYAASQLSVADLDRPQRVLLVPDTSPEWVPYIGPPVADERPIKDEREKHPFDDR